MGDYVLAIAGIAVSIALFLLGYRQTIGAKRERVRSANDEIEKILVRRIVLEEYTPRVADIGRLIDGKSRDFRVRAADLLAESQFLNNIFTRVVETDFIPREQREKILNRLAPVLAEVEEEPVSEEALLELPSPRRIVTSKTMATITMGIMASLVGGVVAILPEMRGLEVKFSELLPMILGTATASLAVIAFLISFYRIREQQQEGTSKRQALSSYVEFEREVLKTLTKAGLPAWTTGPSNRPYDFVVDRGGRKVLVEVKAWKRPMPSQIVKRVVERLAQALAREDASEAILVTQSDVGIRSDSLEHHRVKVMTLRDFRNYLMHAPSD